MMKPVRVRARSNELGRIWIPAEAPFGASPEHFKIHLGRVRGVPR